jgi:glycosyltransferase involved in cell wall biosynthesis
MASMRVVLGAHTINPASGGEGSIGWGWAEGLARHPSVSSVRVMAHPMSRETVEERLGADPTLSKLTFEWVLPPSRIDPWDPKKRDRRQWHRLLAHYQLWQRAAAERARRFDGGIDVAHHITPGTIFLRSFVAELGIPYIIGPVGGGQVAPLPAAVGLLRAYGDTHGAIEIARSLLVKPMSHRRSFRRRIEGAVTVFCANGQTLRLASRYQIRSELMIDSGVSALPSERATFRAREQLILWVGKFEARKDPEAALDLAEALAPLLPAARVVMVGDGWLGDRVRKAALTRKLDNIIMLGPVEHGQLADLYASASLFLFTSVRDTFGAQNLEAMSHGLPIVYRESPGVGLRDFAQTACIGIPAGPTWAAASARAVSAILADQNAWQSLSNSARTAAATFTWGSKVNRAVDWYERALAPSR